MLADIKKKRKKAKQKTDVFQRVFESITAIIQELREILTDTTQSKDKNIWQRSQKQHKQSSTYIPSVH